MPTQSIDLSDFTVLMEKPGKKNKVLQDIFLSAIRETKNPVTMFLVNGVMLQGQVAAYDLFCMLLEREGMVQLVYKHAISTVQPGEALNLSEFNDGQDDG